MVNAPGNDSYPIASFTYLLVYDDLQKVTKSIDEAKAVVHMIHWMITDGQDHSASLLYVPLSDSVAEIGKQGLGKVKYGDNVLFDYSGGVVSTNGDSTGSTGSSLALPEWIKNIAKFWAEGQISDEEYVQSLQFLIQQGIIKI